MAHERKIIDMLLTATGLGYSVEFEATIDSLFITVTNKDHKEITDTRPLIKSKVTEGKIVQGIKYIIHDLEKE